MKNKTKRFLPTLLITVLLPLQTMGQSEEEIISFADWQVALTCIDNWDTNGDRQLSKEEAAAVTDLGEIFTRSSITSFNELQYFTGLTAIANNAFRSCKRLTSITIPDGVKRIGSRAFMYCEYLDSINIGDSVEAIGQGAFYENTSLRAAIIGRSVKEIGVDAFNYCISLTQIEVDSENTVFDSRNNCNAIIRTETNELIQGCVNTLIPNTVTRIGPNAFEYCRGLPTIYIPQSVTSIGSFAFRNCRQMASIFIPRSVTSIGKGSDGSDDNPFSGCYSLTSIIVENGNPAYDSRENCNAIINTASNKLIAGCQNTVVPNMVTAIADYAFDGMIILSDINLPSSLTSIGEAAFNNCSSLADFTIPENVISVGRNAFYKTLWYNMQPDGQMIYKDDVFLGYKGKFSPIGNQEIKSGTRVIAGGAFHGNLNTYKEITAVTLPSSLKGIGDHLFYGCESLTSVTSYIKNPILVSESTFKGIETAATLYVPKGTRRKYQSTPHWSDYFSAIEEIEVPFEPYGDVNSDGIVDVADIAAVIDVMADVEADPVSARDADINDDGVIDVADIATIIDVMAK